MYAVEPIEVEEPLTTSPDMPEPVDLELVAGWIYVLHEHGYMEVVK